MKIKNIFLSILAIVALVGGVFAYSGVTNAEKPENKPNNGNSHNKITGGVWFHSAYGDVHLSFEAHETQPAKGHATWDRTTISPNHWSGSVVETSVNSPTEGTFVVRVEEGTPPAVVGCDIGFKVFDDGEPGSGNDAVQIISVEDQPDTDSCGADSQVQGPWDVYDGNLVVHYSEQEPTATPTEGPALEPLSVGGPEVQGLSHDNGDDHGKPENTPNNGESHDKATGDVGYTAGGLQRYAKFDVHDKVAGEMHFDILGDWVIDMDFGSIYSHDMTVTSQTDGEIEGEGGYPAGVPSYSHPWTMMGTIDGYQVELTITYGSDAPNPGYQVYLTGEVETDGSMSGTCTTSASQSCTWETSSGKANLHGEKGTFHYSDDNGAWYDVNVTNVNFDSNQSWFAGEVILASNPAWVGNWLSASVQDNATPGSDGDLIWGIFTDITTANDNTDTPTDPGSSYEITSGNLMVH